jgi:hypothetical protein
MTEKKEKIVCQEDEKRMYTCTHKSHGPKGQETHKKRCEKWSEKDENWQNNLNNIRNGREHKKRFYRFKREFNGKNFL